MSIELYQIVTKEDFWPDVIEKGEFGPGNYSNWLGRQELEVSDFDAVKFSTKPERKPALIRFKELARLKQMQRDRFEANVPDLENWGYGEGVHYIQPLGHGPTAHSRRIDMWGKRMALADMGFPNKKGRRCVSRLKVIRCRQRANDGEYLCDRHRLMIAQRYLSRTQRAFLDNFFMRYKGALADQAFAMLKIEDELSLSGELALQRQLLQEAMEYVETVQKRESRDNLTLEEVKMLRGQIEAIGALVKQSVDTQSKIAYTSRDMDLVNSRIVQGVMKYVEESYQQEFINFITGKGTENVGQLFAAEISQGESEKGASTPEGT